MSTLILHRALPRPTSFERLLLRGAASVDHYVAQRIGRRTADAARTLAQQHRTDERRTAQALGATGVLPR